MKAIAWLCGVMVFLGILEAAIPLAPSLAMRYSGRAYDASRLVSSEQCMALMEAARYAPSCYNDQPWNFIFCDRSKNPKAFAKALNCLVEFNQNWANKAALLVIVVAADHFHENKQPNRWGPYDSGAAAMSLCVQAGAMGLMAHQMGGFDAEKVAAEFKIPKNYMPMSVIAVGYEDIGKEKQPATKERLALEANFFENSWGEKVTSKR